MLIPDALKKYCAQLGIEFSSEVNDDFILQSLDKDNLLKHKSLLVDKPLTVIATFYNEAPNVIPFYLECCRLDRIFNLEQMIFVQNGSIDHTSQALKELAQYDSRIKVVEVNHNQGYGYGLKQGLKACQTDLVLLNHADCQFDAYAFFTQHFPTVMRFDPETDVILPVRRGRTVYVQFRSSLLRWFAFLLLKQAAKEFNGQPKLFLKSKIGNVDTLPNNFSFDIGVAYRLMVSAKHNFFLDAIELPRFDGKSSWATAFMGQVKLAGQYVGSIMRFRKDRHV